jgi:hypothetical protein
MAPLLAAVCHFVQTRPNAEQTFELAKKMLGDKIGNPLFLTHSAGLLAGGAIGGMNRLKAIFIMSIGNIYDEKLIDRFLKVKSKVVSKDSMLRDMEDEREFCAAVEMVSIGMSVDEALAS